MDVKALIQLVADHVTPSANLCSRAHPLPKFGDGNVWVKRDDELGGLLGGSKLRKFASLVPWLCRSHYTDVIILGGSRANSPAMAAQLLTEQGLKAHFLGKGQPTAVPSGNELILRLLLGPECIHWLSRGDAVLPAAQRLAHQLEDAGRRPYILAEGADCPPAVIGALSLAIDIIRNESESGIRFEHYVFDAGTGLTAAAAITGLALLGRQETAHVILVAGNEQSFSHKLAEINAALATYGILPPVKAPSVICHTPPTAAAFGSVNATVLDASIRFARQHGLLADPIYTTKLLLAAEDIYPTYLANAPTLLVHSGGTTGLFGFGEQLAARPHMS